MKKQNLLLVAIIGLSLAVPAFAAGPDMSAITGAVDAGTIVVAIGAVAAIKILPGVARWGYAQVMKLFR